MRAEIIAVGDELTSGQRLDTNSQWLAERLLEIGVPGAFYTSVGESDLEAMLPDLIARDRYPLVGITVHQATITLRITAEGETAAAARAAMQPTIDTIHQCLGDLIFGYEDDELE